MTKEKSLQEAQQFLLKTIELIEQSDQKLSDNKEPLEVLTWFLKQIERNVKSQFSKR